MATIASIDNAPAPAAGRFASTLCSFNRPANTSAYASGDAISDANSLIGGGENVLFFPVGKSGLIHNALLIYEELDTIALRLYLFDTEPTGQADNEAVSLVAADIPYLITTLEFADASQLELPGSLADVRYPTMTSSANNDQVFPFAFSATGGGIFGILQTDSVFTPTSAAKWTVRLGVEL